MKKVDDPMGSLICGAKTRAGGTCRQPPMPNGRCRYHGGMSLSGKAHGRYTRGKYTKDALANRRELMFMLRGMQTGLLKPKDLYGIENNIDRCGGIRDHLIIANILLLARQAADKQFNTAIEQLRKHGPDRSLWDDAKEGANGK